MGEEKKRNNAEIKYPYAYVDGSYNSKTGVYGYGGFLSISENEEIILSGSGNDRDMAIMRNISGEILGAIAAVKEAEKQKLKEESI